MHPGRLDLLELRHGRQPDGVLRVLGRLRVLGIHDEDFGALLARQQRIELLVALGLLVERIVDPRPLQGLRRAEGLIVFQIFGIVVVDGRLVAVAGEVSLLDDQGGLAVERAAVRHEGGVRRAV